MKPYLFALLVLTAPLSGYYEKAKTEISDLRFTAKLKSVLFGHEAYYALGAHDGYRHALVVISMWERKYQPKKPPLFKIKDDILVLKAISNELANEGHDFIEDSWTGQGYRSALERSISLLEGKPFLEDGRYH